MIDHAAGSFRLDDHPCGVTLFQLISDLHAGPWRRARLGPKGHLRMGLPTLNGDAIHIDVHGAQVEGVEGSEMLRDSSANGVGIALLLFASARQDDRDGERRNRRDLFGLFQLCLPRIGARIVSQLTPERAPILEPACFPRRSTLLARSRCRSSSEMSCEECRRRRSTRSRWVVFELILSLPASRHPACIIP